MTKSKKMLALVIALVVMLVAVSGTLIAVLVAGNQNAQSKVHVKYTSSDVNVRVEAKYYVGSTGTDMVDKSNSNATSIELDANKTTGSLDQPSNDAVELSKINSKIIYEYKFTNLSTTIPATIGQLVENGSVVVPKDSNNNVKLTYTSSSTSLGSGATSDATTLNTQGLPAGTTRYVYVIVSIVELLNDVDFEGTFGWDLAKGTTASLDTTGSGNSIVNVNTSQTGFYNAAALQNIDLVVGVENQEPEIYPIIAEKCFIGWYTDADLQTKAVFPMVVNADTKLYPKHLDATSDLTYDTYDESWGTEECRVGYWSAYRGSATELVIADAHKFGSSDIRLVSTIDTEFAREDTSVEKITIPGSITDINSYVRFNSWSNLTQLEVAKSNKIYFSDNNCIIERKNKRLYAGIKTSIIPNSVEIIGSSSFSGCANLTAITIPESVKRIECNAFENCTNLTSATFKTTAGWTVTTDWKATTGTAETISTTDLAANATLLTTTHVSKYWNRA